jgi:hypothetical protein
MYHVDFLRICIINSKKAKKKLRMSIRSCVVYSTNNIRLIYGVKSQYAIRTTR